MAKNRLNWKRVVQWIVVFGTALFVLGSLVAISRVALNDKVLISKMLHEHLRAVVGLPMSAAAAFCLVVILEITSGDIEFEALGFKFKGASGPIVLWVLSFLVFVLALRLLW